jgi:nicotinamide-nucleotide amidase
VYSEEAKKRLLGVKQATIDKNTLTSEAVAIEMVLGAIKKTSANVIIAITGITGDKPMDGIPAGTICFAWGIKIHKKWTYFTETKKFTSSRSNAQLLAAKYGLKRLVALHAQLK